MRHNVLPFYHILCNPVSCVLYLDVVVGDIRRAGAAPVRGLHLVRRQAYGGVMHKMWRNKKGKYAKFL